ncbi:MAG: iron-containing alcohol dehydrogenase [Geminicoccaceae bacterium]
MATLVHVLTLGGLGVVVTGTSHSGSMGEHGISHYIDMFARPHPGSLHGAQVGVATLTMARLQELLLADEAPPVLRPSLIDDAALAGRYGAQAAACRKALEAKALTGERLAAANRGWPILGRLAPEARRARHPGRPARGGAGAIDAARTGADLGLAPAAYRTAVAHAHEIRDRFGFLDLAAHAGG